MGRVVFAVSVILFAIFLTAARVAFPKISDYRGLIQERVSVALQRPVRIGNIDVAWEGARPVLRIHDVTLRDDADLQDTFHFDSLELSFFALRSIRELKPVLRSAYLSGSELHVSRETDGRILLRGLQRAPDAAIPNVYETLEIVGSATLNLRDIDVVWVDQPTQRTWLMSAHDLRIVLWKKGISLQGQIRLPAQVGGGLDVAAVIRGDLGDYRQWDGNFYAAVQPVNLQEIPLPTDLGLPKIERAALEGKVWGAWWATGGKDLFGDFSLSDLVLAKASDLAGDGVHLPSASSRFHLASSEAGWRLDLDQLKVVSGNGPWPDSGLSVAGTKGGSGPVFQAAVDYLDLAPLGGIAAALPQLDRAHREILAKIDVKGVVRDLSLTWARGQDEMPKYQFSANASDLAWNSSDTLPGLQGVNLSVRGSEKGGQAEVSGLSTQFQFPKLFRAPISLDVVAARASWNTNVDAVRLRVDDVTLANSDAKVSGMIALDLPRHGPPHLWGEFLLPQAPVKKVRHYLPYGILPEATGKWLGGGLLGGQLSDGLVSFDGLLVPKAFSTKKFHLNAGFNVDQGRLFYLKDYPELEKLSGRVIFEDASVRADISAGQVHGNDIRGGSVRVDDFFRSELLIDAQAHGSLSNYLDFLAKSPLTQGSLRSFLKDVASSGNAGLELKLDVPLSKSIDRPMSVDGRVALEGGYLSLPARDVYFDDPKGLVSFTTSEFHAEGISAVFRGQPVVVGLDTQQDRTINVNVLGNFALKELIPKGAPELLDLVPGRSDFHARVEIPRHESGENQVKLHVSSQLRGIAILAPVPLSKAANAIRDFDLSWELGPEVPQVTARLGQDLRAKALVMFEGDRLNIERADVVVGSDGLPHLGAQGITIRGWVPQLNVTQWLATIDHVRAGGDAEEGALDLRSVRLRTNKLEALGYEFADANVVLERGDAVWDIAVDAADVKGGIRWPDHWRSGTPVMVDLDRLVLPRTEGEGESLKLGAQVLDVGVKPTDLPTLEFICRDLRWGNALFNDASLSAIRSDKDWIIKKALFVSPRTKIQAAGAWLDDASGQWSRLQLKMEGADFGTTFKNLEFSSALGSGNGFVQGDLRWEGVPWLPHVPSLEGSASIELKNGVLKDVDPGLGRLLALLNIDNLPRRLALNFKDVALDGLHYDTLSGSGEFDKGSLRLNGVVIDSPAAVMTLMGSTGLVSRDYNLNLNIVPKFKSAVPLAAGLVLAPQTGIAFYLLEKLATSLGVDINELGLLRYTVKGSWEHPVTKPVLVDDPADPPQKRAPEDVSPVPFSD